MDKLILWCVSVVPSKKRERLKTGSLRLELLLLFFKYDFYHYIIFPFSLFFLLSCFVFADSLKINGTLHCSTPNPSPYRSSSFPIHPLFSLPSPSPHPSKTCILSLSLSVCLFSFPSPPSLLLSLLLPTHTHTHTALSLNSFPLLSSFVQPKCFVCGYQTMPDSKAVYK